MGRSPRSILNVTRELRISHLLKGYAQAISGDQEEFSSDETPPCGEGEAHTSGASAEECKTVKWEFVPGAPQPTGNTVTLNLNDIPTQTQMEGLAEALKGIERIIDYTRTEIKGRNVDEGYGSNDYLRRISFSVQDIQNQLCTEKDGERLKGEGFGIDWRLKQIYRVIVECGMELANRSEDANRSLLNIETLLSRQNDILEKAWGSD